jgi:hypothetical protein
VGLLQSLLEGGEGRGGPGAVGPRRWGSSEWRNGSGGEGCRSWRWTGPFIARKERGENERVFLERIDKSSERIRQRRGRTTVGRRGGGAWRRGAHAGGQQGRRGWQRDPVRGAWRWRGGALRRCGYSGGRSSGGELAVVARQGRRDSGAACRGKESPSGGGVGPGESREVWRCSNGGVGVKPRWGTDGGGGAELR